MRDNKTQSMPGTHNIANALWAGRRLRARDELQNARMRVILGVVISIYLFFSNQYTTEDTFSELARYCMLSYLGIASLIFLSTLHSPAKHPLRPLAGVTLDLTIGAALMIKGGSGTAWLYVGFLWTIIASGIRFGRPYLISATILAVIGFSITLAFSPFWQTNRVMGIGMLAWLLVLPLYISKLLTNLETAIQKADIANQAKSRFLANMSHEIRTPLTAIIGYAETALDKDQGMQERVSALSIIKNSGHHLLTIINDILDFSKIEADEMDIEEINVNPFRVLADVEAIAATHAIQKGLRFEVDYQLPIPAEITSDPVRLRQILLNLCSNAVKFTHQGSVTICVRYLAETNQLQCLVTDTGIGIKQAQLVHIFQPFKQADSSTTRHYGGTGLGLSLSNRLAGLLGGDLNVYSQEDKGTTFTLTVPCGQIGELVHDLQGVDFGNKQQTNPLPASKIRGSILLAEDNTTNQKLITALLKKMGAEVTTANNGAKALELGLKQQYDLIYMDMQMPVMSGVEAVKALRARQYRGAIVALTANATREDRNTCLEAGCDDYLTKPVNRDRLHRITARYLHSDSLTVPAESIQPIYSELLHTDSVVDDLLNDFIEELSSMLNHIKMSFVSEEWQEMRETVHDLKGMGGGFGYPQLSALAAKLEAELKNENYPAARGLLNELDVMCQRIYIGKSPDSACA